nr:helix-turn-helix transcriptional regulator [Polymorphobacter sp.]
MIAAIYDGVFGIPLTGFQRFAVDCIGTVIDHDSAVWINGINHENQVHSCLLVNQPDTLIARYMADYAGIDLVRNHAVRAPGRAFRIEDTMPLDAWRNHPAYRELWRPAGIEHAMALAALDPISQLMELIVLWRSDAARPFTRTDVQALESIAPHAIAAWRHRQLAHLHEQAAERPALHHGVRGNAVCDGSGTIYASDPHFNATMRQHFTGWHGPRLPDGVTAMLRSNRTTHTLAGLNFTLTFGELRHLLSISVANNAPLTNAELRVATLYAEGRTNAQIASTLGITRSTVRNQIAAAYRKLDIHSKAELARRIPQTPA